MTYKWKEWDLEHENSMIKWANIQCGHTWQGMKGPQSNEVFKNMWQVAQGCFVEKSKSFWWPVWGSITLWQMPMPGAPSNPKNPWWPGARAQRRSQLQLSSTSSKSRGQREHQAWGSKNSGRRRKTRARTQGGMISGYPPLKPGLMRKIMSYGETGDICGPWRDNTGW